MSVVNCVLEEEFMSLPVSLPFYVLMMNLSIAADHTSYRQEQKLIRCDQKGKKMHISHYSRICLIVAQLKLARLM